MRTLLFIVALALLPSCKTIAPFIVTEKSLKLAGEEYLLAGDAMDKGLDQGTMSRDEYVVWVEFSSRFRALYRPTVDLWYAAAKARDAALQGDVTAALVRMGNELLVFYDKLKQAKLLPPGAP